MLYVVGFTIAEDFVVMKTMTFDEEVGTWSFPKQRLDLQKYSRFLPRFMRGDRQDVRWVFCLLAAKIVVRQKPPQTKKARPSGTLIYLLTVPGMLPFGFDFREKHIWLL